MQNEIMNYEHPEFVRFMNCLGENLKECKHDFAMTEDILRAALPDVDIEKTKVFMRSKGGYCDCEIMFNVPYHPSCPHQ
jgi:hypothetical protein